MSTATLLIIAAAAVVALLLLGSDKLGPLTGSKLGPSGGNSNEISSYDPGTGTAPITGKAATVYIRQQGRTQRAQIRADKGGFIKRIFRR